MSKMSILTTTPKTLEEALKKLIEFLIFFEKMQKEIAILWEENQRLKEQLNLNSKNSSISLVQQRDIGNT